MTQPMFGASQNFPPLLEYWKPVVGFEGYYEVSNMGNIISVRNTPRTKFRRQRKPVPNVRDGRPYITAFKESRRFAVKVHIAVARAFLGSPPDEHEVNHKNGDKTHNWLSNLEYVTSEYNRHHAIANGLNACGERNSGAILSLKMVREIRIRLGEGVKYKPLAQDYGVSVRAISDIALGHSWKNLL